MEDECLPRDILPKSFTLWSWGSLEMMNLFRQNNNNPKCPLLNCEYTTVYLRGFIALSTKIYSIYQTTETTERQPNTRTKKGKYSLVRQKLSLWRNLTRSLILVRYFFFTFSLSRETPYYSSLIRSLVKTSFSFRSCEIDYVLGHVLLKRSPRGDCGY